MEAGNNGSPPSSSRSLFDRQRRTLRDLSVPAIDTPEILCRKARLLNAKASHAVDDERQGVAYAFGGVGLLAQHTSYYDGFAVVLSLFHATAVCIDVSQSGKHEILFDDVLLERVGRTSSEKSESPKGARHWRQLITRILEKFSTQDTFVTVNVVSSVPPQCIEAFFASVCVAVAKALFDYQEKPVPVGIVEVLREVAEEVLEAEFSKAFIMVSLAASPGVLCVIDTTTEELIPFNAPDRAHLSWGLLRVDDEAPRNFDFYHKCGLMGEEALALLQKGRFPEYTSFRDVQHADLQRVLEALPQKYRLIVRHLVNENKRVQAMIGAIRGEDWQMLGGLLFISHASLSNEWQGTNDVIDFVVADAERMSSEGIYGACMTGRGGYVLVVGLPLALDGYIKEIKERLKARFGRDAEGMIL